MVVGPESLRTIKEKETDALVAHLTAKLEKDFDKNICNGDVIEVEIDDVKYIAVPSSVYRREYPVEVRRKAAQILAPKYAMLWNRGVYLQIAGNPKAPIILLIRKEHEESR